MKRCVFALVACLPLMCLTAVPRPASGQAVASNPAERWEKTIQQFEADDQANPPKAGGVLFVGSSSIRLWDTAKAFPDDGVLNRGFGGSEISDANFYFDRIVKKYEPAVIVFYAGDNDAAKGKSPQQIFADFQAFTKRVADDLPQSHLIFIPTKPSVARWKLWPAMNEANSLIRKHLASRYRWHYADTATPMLGEDGHPQPDLFVADGLHLNEKGYAIWNGVLRTALDRARAIAAEAIAQGTVYHDSNGNRRFDAGEMPLPQVRVSNGREIVVTDAQGRYALPVSDDCTLFVIKPAGWRTPLNEQRLPQFYYAHKPNGSPDLKYGGVPPTGPLPDAIDFPLYPQAEPAQFKAILFGDPQPRDQKEVDYIAHDVIEELIGTDASFGVTLGDIAFDDLRMLEAQARAIALLGIPWYNVIGNHDINYDAQNDRHSDETFERVFGPPYYSFDYGTVHFVVLDDIEWLVDTPGKKGRYRGGFGAEQLEFVRNDLGQIPENQLVVLMMHIPLTDVHDRQPLYRLIERRPFCISISGHTHYHAHHFVTREDGWRGAEPHHHIINVTVSGSWWSGAPDERGIPHTMMACGAPNGYSFITFDGHEYKLDFKAAGRSADYQMNISAPDVVSVEAAAQTSVFANVFNGSERSQVEMQIDTSPEWITMRRTVAVDPVFQRMFDLEKSLQTTAWRAMTRPVPSQHLWQANLPADLEPGSHLIRVRSIDMQGRPHNGYRVVRVLTAADKEAAEREAAMKELEEKLKTAAEKVKAAVTGN
jgi:hypothetical protein